MHLDKIDEKLDKVITRIDSIDITLAKQSKDLEYYLLQTSNMRQELTPLKRSYMQMLGVIKFLGVLALVAGILEGAATFFHL